MRLLTRLRRGKRFNLGIISVVVALLVVSIAFVGGCTRQSSTGEPSPPAPSPPTEPVTPGVLTTQGYVYDDKLGYGFEYPEDWEMQLPEVVDGEETESVLMFTKPGTPTTLIVTVKLTGDCILDTRLHLWYHLLVMKHHRCQNHPSYEQLGIARLSPFSGKGASSLRRLSIPSVAFSCVPKESSNA